MLAMTQNNILYNDRAVKAECCWTVQSWSEQSDRSNVGISLVCSVLGQD